MKTAHCLLLVTSLFVYAITGQSADGAGVVLLNGTGTYSQEGFRSPAQSVDGSFHPENGWAIFRVPGDQTTDAQTAVWETQIDLGCDSGLTFTMHFHHITAGHALGRFRLSVTTDDRSQFADGLNSLGDVTANWTILTNPVVTVPGSMNYSVLADDSILTGGSVPSPATYTISFATPVSGITGIRLEALEHPSLPTNGPGHHGPNGNFQLTEMTLECFGDSDGDGIPDAQDACPSSVLDATVVIDGFDTFVDNVVFATGCSISDLILVCPGDADNHGQFVSCVAHVTNQLRRDGVIDKFMQGDILSAAAISDFP